MRQLIEFQILDENALHYGADFFELMVNAGTAVAEHIMTNIEISTPVVFLCGHGNNGGDGYIAAEILKKNNFDVTLYAVKKPVTITSQKASRRYQFNIHSIDEFENYTSKSTLIVDCLLGSGVKGVLRPPYYELVKQVNEFENIRYIQCT